VNTQRLASVLAAVCALGGFAGCGLVVGSGDYVIGAAPVDAGRSEQDRSVDGLDAGMMGTDAPTGGGIRDGGTIVIGSDAAAGGCGSTVPTTGTDFQKLVTTCVEAVNCDYGVFPVNVSQCITQNYLQATGSVACLSTTVDPTGTCAGYYTCQGDRTARPEDCVGAPSDENSGSCDGNVATTCSGDKYIGVVQNCDQLHGTCATHDDGFGGIQADCAVIPSCTDDPDGTYYCSGNKLYTCGDDGVGYGKDCSAINATCFDPGDGSGASCYFNAPSCTTAGSSCSSNDLNYCTGAGQQFDYDCSRAGLSCAEDDAGAVCVGAGCALPSASTCDESCDGVNATVCIGGAPFTIDCTAYGFRTCSFESGLDNGDYAFCIY
jgi:hypothetical protein